MDLTLGDALEGCQRCTPRLESLETPVIEYVANKPTLTTKEPVVGQATGASC